MSNPTKPTDVGMNRTGIATSPFDSKETIQGAAVGRSATMDGAAELANVRVELSRQAEPVGTVPPPATVKGMAKTVVQALKGTHATVLIDMLGERLAFERTGTRLYDALLCKFEAADEHPGGPTRAELLQIRDEELMHFALLTAAIEKLGADPTAVTPSADIVAVASQGIVQVLSDPRTTFTEALKAILVAELTDNDSWEMLITLCRKIGQDDLATSFEAALADEQRHLMLVRTWLSNAVEGQAGARV
jgi:rubrerythrin